MGQSVLELIEQRADLAAAGVWARGADLDALLVDSDVVIDFSLPGANHTVVSAARDAKLPLVSGVSGLSDADIAEIQSASLEIPVVYDRNMSIGVAVLQRCLQNAAASLAGEFATNVLDVHHVHKLDAPSGTALQLGETIAAAQGKSGTGDVTFESERRGEVPGEHRISFASANEVLEFGHSVTDRRVFANGALRAAAWVVRQPAGLYSMQDVLFS